MTYRKKLIEVALPLKAMNEASVREKSIRHGHPSTLHLWWSRKPLATCRAVLFASLVDDPSAHTEEFPTEQDQERERLRLFQLMEQLITWENSSNQEILAKARAEIFKSTNGNLPPVLDPFCGGGSIPLEAQRLGLQAHGSDLNPVAVLISKALIEIPPKFTGCAPFNPEAKQSLMGREWHRAQGLADDIRYYGKWMRDEAERRIGHLYPKVLLPKEYGSGEATVIAWLWARTVRCPNPACLAMMPLVRSFWVSTKKGKEVWVEPVVDHAMKTVRFVVRHGAGAPEGTVNRLGSKCIVCGSSVPLDHVRTEGKAGRMGAQMMAIVAEGKRERIYLPPDEEHEAIAQEAKPKWESETELSTHPQYMAAPRYGMTRHRDLFTPRQLMALITFSDLVSEAREQVLEDSGGNIAYSNAVATYLALAVDRVVDRHSTICTWDASPSKLQLRNTFARQAIPMSWDFAEGNPFCMSSGTWTPSVEWVAKVVNVLPANRLGDSKQLDATATLNGVTHPIISTDPPYYDNVGYADLSDFFYIWLRRSLNKIYPGLFSTLLVPKSQELIADPF